jgi:2-oxoisovalerate dehydrogenase E1 component alpha subunit
LGEWDDARHAGLTQEIEKEVDAANRRAQQLGVHGGGPYHDPATMFEDVFKEMPWHLREQQEELTRFRASTGWARP